MRLNGWQRIGIVASIIWAISGPLWVYYTASPQQSLVAEEHFGTCLDSKTIDPNVCQTNYEQEIAFARNFLWKVATVVCLMPLLLGWLGTYGIRGVTRWIRVGFRNARKPDEDTP
jgi:hypothetical protein